MTLVPRVLFGGLVNRAISLFRLGLLSILTAIFGFTVAPADAQSKLEKLHVGYSAQAGSLAPIWITKEAGIFQKHGLNVELLFISRRTNGCGGAVVR